MRASNRKPSPKQSVEFHETLTPVVPYAPAAPTIPAVHRIPDNYLRAGLYLVWAVAAILAGIAVGLWTTGKIRTVATEAPVPVAKSQVAVAAVSAPSLVPGGVAAQTQALAVAPATSVNQAQAGNVVALASGGVLQPAAGSDSLQPGFSHYGVTQGKLGTTPVGQ
jgi:hypothetical protein